MTRGEVSIPLLNRKGETVGHAIVDAEDVGLAAQSWYLRPAGYAGRSVGVGGNKQQTILMHRLICGLTVGDRRLVDHIDRNKLNNRRANLRVVTRSGNAQNYPKRPATSSRHRGVSWHKGHKRWVAYGQVNGAFRRLGEYKDENEAGAVALQWRLANQPLATD